MVTQPSGEVMPRPANPNELACCITGRGFPADADTLDGLFKYHVDPVTMMAGGDATMNATRDAQTTPGTFSPQCGLNGTIVLKGGDCQNELRWYNATTPPSKPAANALYPLVPANLMLPPMNCMENGFCPLATRMTSQVGQHTWADPLPEYAAEIRTDRNWAGGQVGFALVPTYVNGQPQGKCSQVKYSEAVLNDHAPSGAPWITTLIYQSVSNPNAYYIAFEDLPTCSASWRGCQPGSNPPMPITDPNSGCDGDFNDFVFYVSGLSCNLGGDPCTVPNAMGICAGGVTECAAGGTATTCRQTVMPTAERCDNLDNDCNGMIDEGNPCLAPDVCSQGVCRHMCDDTEFPCAPGLTCDTTDGLCKDPGCIGRTCGAGQICQRGTCVGGCMGVVCPHGQSCVLGNCVAACDGITCPADRVCENGACQPPCNNKCRSCKAGTMCNMTTGACVEAGCESRTCAAGQVCVAGNCQDGCQGVTCPGGQECMMGSCKVVGLPDGGTSSGSGGGGGFSIIGTGGQGGAIGSGGSNTTTGAGGSTSSGAGGTMDKPKGMIDTCKCETAEGPGAGGIALLLAGLAIAAVRRGRAAIRVRTKM